MSADTTGHKSRVNAFGFYVARNKDNLAHSKIETITQSIEVVRRQPGGGWLFAIDLPFGAAA
jgi:hypothetical protein